MYMHHNNKRSQANEQFLYHLFPRTQAHTHKQKKKRKNFKPFWRAKENLGTHVYVRCQMIH